MGYFGGGSFACAVSLLAFTTDLRRVARGVFVHTAPQAPIGPHRLPISALSSQPARLSIRSRFGSEFCMKTSLTHHLRTGLSVPSLSVGCASDCGLNGLICPVPSGSLEQPSSFTVGRVLPSFGVRGSGGTPTTAGRSRRPVRRSISRSINHINPSLLICCGITNPEIRKSSQPTKPNYTHGWRSRLAPTTR